MTSRVAVLVDGDNLAPDHGDDIMSLAAGFGRIDIARVYADASRSSKWAAECGFRLVHAGCGKNASDMLLMIDAMEMALTQGIEVFAVASSDGDFVHLFQRLREFGRLVVGIGESKAPLRFRACCTEFRLIGKPSPATEQGCAVSAMDRNIRDVIADHSTNGKGMRLADLAVTMYQKHAIRISTCPDKSWRAYLAARPCLYDLEPRGPDAMVRFLPKGFSASENG